MTRSSICPRREHETLSSAPSYSVSGLSTSAGSDSSHCIQSPVMSMVERNILCGAPSKFSPSRDKASRVSFYQHHARGYISRPAASGHPHERRARRCAHKVSRRHREPMNRVGRLWERTNTRALERPLLRRFDLIQLLSATDIF